MISLFSLFIFSFIFSILFFYVILLTCNLCIKFFKTKEENQETKPLIFNTNPINNQPNNILNLQNDLNNVCAICLEFYNKGNTLQFFNCGHYFHTECVQPWIIKNNICPTCRTNINSF